MEFHLKAARTLKPLLENHMELSERQRAELRNSRYRFVVASETYAEAIRDIMPKVAGALVQQWTMAEAARAEAAAEEAAAVQARIAAAKQAADGRVPHDQASLCSEIA